MRRSLVLAFAVIALFLFGISSAYGVTSSPATSAPVASTTTFPVPETSHAGVRRVLLISLPAISWEDLDLSEMPHLSALFAKSAVADLSVRGVGRVPSLADGYVTIGAGTRSVGHPDNDGQCLEPDEPFDQSTARQEMARAQRSAREHGPAVVDPVSGPAPDRVAQQRAPVQLRRQPARRSPRRERRAARRDRQR